jgi:hypothetical protein
MMQTEQLATQPPIRGSRQVLYSITKHAMRRSADEIGATSISFRLKVFRDATSVVDGIFSTHRVSLHDKNQPRVKQPGSMSGGGKKWRNHDDDECQLVREGQTRQIYPASYRED